MALARTCPILVALAVIGGPLMAESRHQSDREKCPCELISLRIKFPKKVVKAGEDVDWEVEFTNKSERPITFYWRCNGFFEFVTITIRHVDSGKIFVYDLTPFSPYSLEWQSYTLMPGESKSQERLFNEKDPGTYVINAEFEYLGIRTKAKPVIVKVIPEK